MIGQHAVHRGIYPKPSLGRYVRYRDDQTDGRKVSCVAGMLAYSVREELYWIHPLKKFNTYGVRRAKSFFSRLKSQA